MDTKDRLKQLNDIYNHLRVIGKVTSKKQMAEAIGANSSTLASAFGGDKRYLTDNLFVMKIGKAFPEVFEPLWLQTGIGEMLRPATNGLSMNNVSGVGVQAQGNAKVVMPQMQSDESLSSEVIRLRAENETLKQELEWLRGTLTQLLAK